MWCCHDSRLAGRPTRALDAFDCALGAWSHASRRFSKRSLDCCRNRRFHACRLRILRRLCTVHCVRYVHVWRMQQRGARGGRSGADPSRAKLLSGSQRSGRRPHAAVWRRPPREAKHCTRGAESVCRSGIQRRADNRRGQVSVPRVRGSRRLTKCGGVAQPGRGGRWGGRRERRRRGVMMIRLSMGRVPSRRGGWRRPGRRRRSRGRGVERRVLDGCQRRLSRLLNRLGGRRRGQSGRRRRGRRRRSCLRL